MIDEILKKFKVKYEDLNKDEKETLHGWMEALEKNQLTVDSIREYISSMKSAVEDELSKSDLGDKQDIFLKARLRNYMILEAFMSTPEKARKRIEGALSSMGSK